MKGRVLVIFFSIHFLSTGICSASADGSDIYVRPVRDFSRLEGGTAETNVNNTGYIAVIELRMNDTSVKPLLGAIISKRNILTTANYLDQAVWASQGLSISTIEVTLKATSGSPTKITNLAMTNVIKHPKYVSPNAATSEDDFLQYQPAILTLSSDAVLGISDDLRAIPISCSPTDTKLGDTVTVLDWSKPSSTVFELQKATYSRKACPSGNPSLTKEWSLCFQLPTASSYSVSDMGKIGSPIVLNYGNNANVSLIAVKAMTYAVSANESLTAASSMSYSEIYSFVCQYADSCINNASAVTTPATTAAPASATTLAANATTNANATGTANNNATTTVPANNNATTTTVAINGTTTTKSNVTIIICRHHDNTGPCANQDGTNKWFGFMQLINIGIRYVFG